MKSHNAQQLRTLVENDQSLPDPVKAELLAELRAEAFWNDRAPVLNDEVLALRPLERFARLVLSAGGLTATQASELRAALAHLDRARAGTPAPATKGNRGKAA